MMAKFLLCPSLEAICVTSHCYSRHSNSYQSTHKKFLGLSLSSQVFEAKRKTRRTNRWMLLKNYQEILVDFDMDATSLWLLSAPSFFSQHQSGISFFPIPKGYINKTTDGLWVVFFFNKSLRGVPRLLHLTPHSFGRSQISHYTSSRKAVRDKASEGWLMGTGSETG